jgi:Zn finger protein HypA/HybF involved in hydrogenase expression
LAPDYASGVRFECLGCGKDSKVERLQTIQPRCGKCGSVTGVIGDIGQGTLTARLRRNFRIGGDYDGEIKFECLTCGETTDVEKVIVLQPKCLHCGAVSGLLVEGAPPAALGVLLASALLGMLDPGP